MDEIDIARAPRGVLAAQTLVGAVAGRGDLAERHYLELKSSLDLSSKKDREKIAKFILGAGNRLPETAAVAFEGYAVLVIGVSQGSVDGIQPVEMMEISRVIQRYVGAAGPHWDIIWVPIEGSRQQVLIILVDPPKAGQGPFPCRANGESLADGRVYVRADGETREAKSDELDLLVQRGAKVPPAEVDFAVEVIGEPAFMEVDPLKTIDKYLDRRRSFLIGEIEGDSGDVSAGRGAPVAGLSGASGYVSALSAALGASTVPESRSGRQYRDSISRWEHEFRGAWPKALARLAASSLQPVSIRVVNRTTTFLHDVELRLSLEGDVFAYELISPESADSLSDLELPSPPRKWGPTQRKPDLLGPLMHSGLYVPDMTPYRIPSVSFKNGGSVTMEIRIGDLRPRGVFESEDDELVLLVADSSLTSIRGYWEVTARDHNTVFAGEIDVPIGATVDMTDEVMRILGLAGVDSDERFDG